MNISEVREIREYEDMILNLVDKRDEMTRSDVQGVATMICLKLLRRGIEIGGETK